MIFGVTIGLLLFADCVLGNHLPSNSDFQPSNGDSDIIIQMSGNSSSPSLENVTILSESRKAMMKTHILSDEEG